MMDPATTLAPRRAASRSLRLCRGPGAAAVWLFGACLLAACASSDPASTGSGPERPSGGDDTSRRTPQDSGLDGSHDLDAGDAGAPDTVQDDGSADDAALPDTTPDGARGGDASTDVRGEDGGEDVVSDPCADRETCESAGRRCTGETLVLCEADDAGCLVETETRCDDVEGGFCDPASTPPRCAVVDVDPCADVEECGRLSRVCRGDELVVCAADAAGCQVETRTDCAATGRFCDATSTPNCAEPAACDGPAACEPGAFVPRCDDAARLRTCEGGGDGCGTQQVTDCGESGQICVDGDGGASCAAPPECGDGSVEGDEGCDDGARTDGDGCDASCDVEEGWTCDGSPSRCERLPVDGDRCDVAIRVGAGITSTYAIESFTNTLDSYPARCTASGDSDGPGDGPEAFFVVEVPADTRMRVAGNSPDFLGVVAVAGSCDFARTCEDYSVTGRVEATNSSDAPADYFIAMDSAFDDSAGPFNVEIEFLAR